jgi:hypothetical protein
MMETDTVPEMSGNSTHRARPLKRLCCYEYTVALKGSIIDTVTNHGYVKVRDLLIH